MNKYIALLLVVVVSFSLCACGKGTVSYTEPTHGQTSSSTPISTVTPTPIPTPTPTPIPTPTPMPMPTIKPNYEDVLTSFPLNKDRFDTNGNPLFNISELCDLVQYYIIQLRPIDGEYHYVVSCNGSYGTVYEGNKQVATLYINDSYDYFITLELYFDMSYDDIEAVLCAFTMAVDVNTTVSSFNEVLRAYVSNTDGNFIYNYNNYFVSLSSALQNEAVDAEKGDYRYMLTDIDAMLWRG